jgi:predicted glycosyltransferase
LSVLIKKKDILEDLMMRSGIDFENILPEGRKDSKVGIAWGVLKRDWRLLRYCISNRPDLLIGTSTEIGHIGTLLNIPSINVNEDDATVVPLYCKISYPWSSHILSPRVCNNGKWEKKSIKYESYHELAYLHPGHFTPSKEVVRKYLNPDKPYFVIRFAKLSAHHDTGIRGILNDLALEIIQLLKPYGNIHITAERPLDERFENYRLKIDPLDIHHVMAFTSLFIGDSQTMAAEAGVLGTPFIRFNDFVGRIGYLNELENTYKLGFGIKPDKPEKLLKAVSELMLMKDRDKVFENRRQKMLEDKINLADFMTWLIESYPESINIVRSDSNYQYNFK